jgi:hypothetical protein
VYKKGKRRNFHDFWKKLELECAQTQRMKTINFLFKKSIYDRLVAPENFHKNLLLQKISEKNLCSVNKYLKTFSFGVLDRAH